MEKLLSSTSNPTPRIQRWVLQVQAYDTVIQYQPESSNPEDYVSLHPSLPSHQLNYQSAEYYINMITCHATPKSISIDQIGNEISKNITLQQVIESIQTNHWFKHLQSFYTIRHQLSVYNKVLLKDRQIVIPKTPYSADCAFIASRNPKDKKSTAPKCVVANTQSRC